MHPAGARGAGLLIGKLIFRMGAVSVRTCFVVGSKWGRISLMHVLFIRFCAEITRYNGRTNSPIEMYLQRTNTIYSIIIMDVHASITVCIAGQWELEVHRQDLFVEQVLAPT